MAVVGAARADVMAGAAQDNGTIVADDRPQRRAKEENWNDHTCSLYKDAVYNVTAVAAPQVQLAAASA